MDKVIQSKVLCQLFYTLFENRVCLRCILRLMRSDNIHQYRDIQGYQQILTSVGEQLGNKNLFSYDPQNYCLIQIDQVYATDELVEVKLPSNMKDQIIQKPTTFLQTRFNDCIICLGLLQKIDNQDFIDRVVNKINEDDYEFESFKLTVKTSLAFQVRQLCTMSIAIESVKVWAKQNSLAESLDILNLYQLPNSPIEIKVVIKWLMSAYLSDRLSKKSDAGDERFNINMTFENLQDDFVQFHRFKDTVLQMDDQQWEEKLNKKLKMNDQELKSFTRNRLEQKRQQQVQAFVPSQYNLERVVKIPSGFIQNDLMKNKYPLQSQVEVKVEIKAAHQNILIKGNYIKLARFLSQTPWIYNNERQYETSISEVIGASCQELFKSNEVKFHSGGSKKEFFYINSTGEDVDVRMLGDGRPFVIELVDPHRGQQSVNEENINRIYREINLSTQVNVSPLQFTDLSCFMELKNSETNKIKAYCCLVQTSKVVDSALINKANELIDLIVDQKTPIRVLHRRTLLNRQKTIHKLKIERINHQFLIVSILASAGTYIKEFVHSDLNRTKPSLCDLFECECDIFQLDVIKLYPSCDQESLKDFMQISVLPK